MTKTSKLWVSLIVFLAGTLVAKPVPEQEKNVPWWQQQKIRFMWGQWGRTWNSGCAPDALMARLANIGTTVYAA